MQQQQQQQQQHTGITPANGQAHIQAFQRLLDANQLPTAPASAITTWSNKQLPLTPAPAMQALAHQQLCFSGSPTAQLVGGMPMAVPMAMVPAVAMAPRPNDGRKRARKTYLQNAGRNKRNSLPYAATAATAASRGQARTGWWLMVCSLQCYQCAYIFPVACKYLQS